MAGTDNVDAHRLPGRARRQARRHAPDREAIDPSDAEAEDEIEAVNRLMGFLRRDDPS